MNTVRTRTVFLVAIIWLAKAVACLAADASAGPSITRLHFSTNSAGETVLQHGEKIGPAKDSKNLLNVSQLSKTRGAQFSLIPEDAIISITSEQFPGWMAELPPKQSLRFSFDYENRMLDLQTSDLNREAVKLNFSDGARVEMDAKADGRLEVTNDGSYAFFGSGSMVGTNADGAPVRFAHVFPPMFGGKLIAPATNDVNGRFSRQTPVTPIVFLGQLDSGLSARVGDRTVPLAPGTPQNVRMENGAEVALLLNPATHTVDWEVKHGVFRIAVDGFQCWKALGASGQTAAMQWNTNGTMMEIHNRNGTNSFRPSVLVNLSPTLNVAAGSSATFQYGRTSDCTTFVATAYGGETTLYNATTHSYFRLDDGNVSIVSGGLDSGARVDGRTLTPVRVNWTGAEELELKSGKEAVKVLNGAKESFKADEATEITATFTGGNNLALQVDAGGVSVTPSFMPTISFEMLAGSGITLWYDQNADILRAEPALENLSPIGLRTATGFYPRLLPGKRLTFVINRSTFAAGADEGALIFTETAGAGSPTSLTTATPFRSLPNGRGSGSLLSGTLDGSRVPENPVTTLE